MPHGSEETSALSFVIPVLDEVDGIAELWTALCGAGDRLVADGCVRGWEAVVVDDGSTDGSAEALDQLASTDPRCRVFHHASNAGLGQALRTGFAAAAGDVLVYTDADLPFDLATLPALLQPVLDGTADLISGRRIGRAREGRWRAVQSVAYNSIVRALFRLPVADVNFACKVFHRRAIAPALRSDSGFIDVEWLVWVHRSGLRIRQVPVEFAPRRWGSSTLGGRAEVLALARELVAHRRRVRGRGQPAVRLDRG